MPRTYDDEDRIPLGLEDDEGQWVDDEEDWIDDEEDAPGPDDRDLDLLDGTWEQRYYSGRVRQFDWNSVLVAFALLALMAMLLPAFLYVLG